MLLSKIAKQKKWVTIGKINHTWKNGSHLEKELQLGKISQLKKKGLTWKDGSHLEKSRLEK